MEGTTTVAANETTAVVDETTTAEPVVETTTAEPVETTTAMVEATTTAMVEETTTAAEQPAAGQLASFNVTSLTATLTANVSETINVTANVTNPNDQQATQPVELRLDADLVEQRNVTMDAGETRNVTFEFDTSDVAPGLHVLSIQTRQFGEASQITLLRQPATATPTANETTTEPAVEETTTEEPVVEETTTEEPIEETTTEPAVEETTTEEPIEETTTEEPVVEETTTEEPVEEPVEETTTEEPVVEETTTEEPVVEETTTEEPEQVDRLVFSVDRLHIDNWSFVVGDELEPDRTQVIEDISISNRTKVINLTRMLMENETDGMLEEADQETLTPGPTTPGVPEDIPTVRFVLRDITITNVTFIVELPATAEVVPETPVPTPTETPEPVETTTEEPVVETTTEEPIEETTTEEPIEETTTEEPIEETTTEEPVVETTTEEPIEETTTEEPVEETTTEEPVVETTTEEPVVETTTEEQVDEEQVQSFLVANLTAPRVVSVGETVTVTANVTNPTDQQMTQVVEYRVNGNLVTEQNVTLDAGESQTVTFELDTTGLVAGTYIHGVLTSEYGELALLTLQESTDEGATEEPVGEDETTSDEEGVGTEEFETTTEEA